MEKPILVRNMQQPTINSTGPGAAAASELLAGDSFKLGLKDLPEGTSEESLEKSLRELSLNPTKV